MDRWERVFTDLVAARGPSLLDYAYLLCGDRAEACDLVQEGLVKAFSRTRRGWGLDNAEAYVRRAVLTSFLDTRRRRSQWQRIRHLVAGSEVQGGMDDRIVASDHMRMALDTLSPQQRACVVLRYYEDMSVPVIADHLGTSTGTVKRYLSEALTRIAGQMRASEGEDLP